MKPLFDYPIYTPWNPACYIGRDFVHVVSGSLAECDPFQKADPAFTVPPGCFDSVGQQIRIWRDATRYCHTIEELIANLSGRSLPCFVSIVIYDLAYGGPEEGGWYYDVNTRLECHYVASAAAAAAVVNRCREWYTNEGRPEVSSVLSRGQYYYQVSPLPAPKHDPESRPHYE